MVINILIGALMGYLAAMGIGGGTLLILWLTFIIGMDALTARAINLMFFIVSAGIVSLLRWRKGQLQIKSLLPAILAGCICAAIFSYLSFLMDVEKIKKLFGIILIISGIRELFYRPKEFK